MKFKIYNTSTGNSFKVTEVPTASKSIVKDNKTVDADSELSADEIKSLKKLAALTDDLISLLDYEKKEHENKSKDKDNNISEDDEDEDEDNLDTTEDNIKNDGNEEITRESVIESDDSDTAELKTKECNDSASAVIKTSFGSTEQVVSTKDTAIADESQEIDEAWSNRYKKGGN